MSGDDALTRRARIECCSILDESGAAFDNPARDVVIELMQLAHKAGRSLVLDDILALIVRYDIIPIEPTG